MEKRKSKRKIIKFIILILLVAILAWTIWANKALELNSFTITSKELPKSFDGYRIAQISDLHNTEFGKGNEKLIELLKQASPDIIAITGDLIDSNHTNMAISLEFAKRAMEIAPCYYVSGNHEGLIDRSEYEYLKAELEKLGVVVLCDSEAVIEKDGEKISITGIDDPITTLDGIGLHMGPTSIKNLASSEFAVLLSHRPEYFQQYVQSGVNIVLAGHAHGGQFRLPFIGGLYVPNQGLFPEYDSGLYSQGNTNMIVSRGLGNSRVPLRFNNRPEVVLVELKTEN